MARLIRSDETGPKQIDPTDKPVFVCMCGLSKNKPFCDGSHKLTRTQEQPGKLYRYENDQAIEIEE